MEPVGYVWDGAMYHPECFPNDLIDPDDEEVGAIFSWQDDACTSTCDECHESLLECDEEEEEW